MTIFDAPDRSAFRQELGLLPRFYSAIAFMLAGSVPVAFFFLLFGFLMPGVASMETRELLMMGLMPIATAGCFGFVSGVKIMDPWCVDNGFQAVARGLWVAFLSYAVFILLLFGVLIAATTAGGDTTQVISFAAPILVFGYGLIFVGIPIAAAGSLGGWLLFRFSLRPNVRARIAASPPPSSNASRIWRATAIAGMILSCAPAFVSTWQFSEGKREERMDLDLMLAVSDGSPSRVNELLSAGADIEARDGAGGTPILWAAREGRTEIVKALLGHGANPNVVARGNGNMTPLIWAAAQDNLECVQMPLEHGADVNASTTQGYTALMEAAQHGMPETVKLLLDHGADPDWVNGRNALEVAKAHRSIPSKVDVTAGQSFTDPIAIRNAEKRHDEIVQILQAREGKE